MKTNVTQVWPEIKPEPAEEVIHFDSVVARFGQLHAMGPTNLTVRRGEFPAPSPSRPCDCQHA